jgi:phenylalanyl-tRNA synthetase beta chain
MRLAGMVCGSANELQWGRKEQGADFFDIKGDVQALLAPQKPVFEAAEHPAMHPGRCARVVLDGVAIGFVGELHPKWRQAYDLVHAPLMFELELDAVLQRDVPVFKAVPKHQAVERDIAVLVQERVTHDALMAAVWAAPTEGLLRNATLFDIYRPKPVAGSEAAQPEKSMAIRLTLNSEEATLTEEQIERSVQSVLNSLVTTLGARQRA